MRYTSETSDEATAAGPMLNSSGIEAVLIACTDCTDISAPPRGKRKQ